MPVTDSNEPGGAVAPGMARRFRYCGTQPWQTTVSMFTNVIENEGFDRSDPADPITENFLGPLECDLGAPVVRHVECGRVRAVEACALQFLGCGVSLNMRRYWSVIAKSSGKQKCRNFEPGTIELFAIRLARSTSPRHADPPPSK